VPGFELSGFSEITPIARGGFSEIFRATDDLTGRSVALKVIAARGIPALAYGAFRREAAALGSLGDHPHIVTLYQAIERGNETVLVLELCQESTGDLLERSGPLSTRLVLEYGIKIAGALQTAHDCDVIHRDIKPQNVLITRYGEPALADFGIARLQASSSQATAAGSRSFTAVHAPPEVLQGGAIGGSSDVYELASTLHTWLDGRAPFAGETGEPVARTILRILREPAPRLENADVPAELVEVLLRCLEKDARDRPSSPLEVARELMGIETSLGLVPTDVALSTDAGLGPRLVAVVREAPCDLGPADPEHQMERAGDEALGTVFEEVPSDGGPERISAVGHGVTGNLPGEVSSFVGRERELAEVRQLLEAARLVTLAGPGGTGKTRLALRAAADARSARPGGVWFVDLAPLTASDSVSAAIADSLGIVPEPGRTMTESFGSALADARSLLVLDNCEHLADQCARVVEALIGSSGELQVLATSREPLGVAGEHLFRLQPLALPSAEEGMAVGESEAGTLFVARASAQQPLFHLDETNAPLVASICRRLDGIPLAIELAACRLRAMSIEDLDRRLDQRLRVLTGGSRTALPRHQTLAATIAWSYNLLSASEQRLLERLAVFHDGFDLVSAETVGAERGPGAPEVLDGVTSLVDKSLVQAEFPFGGARYRLLETVREFALDHLSERAGEPGATRARHARTFLEMSEEASTHWFGPDESPWLDLLERNHENLNAAIRLYLETADGIGEALRLCGALRIYWRRRGKYVEGAALVERVLETEPGSQDKRLRALCLRTAGSLLFDIGDTQAARARLAEGVELATEVKDLELLDGCLHEIAFILLRQGAHQQVRELTDRVVAQAELSGDAGLLANVRCHRGRLTTMSDPGRARRDLEQALEHFRAVSNAPLVAYALDGLAVLELEQDNPQAARPYLEEGLAYASDNHDRDQLQTWLVNLTWASLLEGDAAAAFGFVRQAVEEGRHVRIAQMAPYHLLAVALCLSAAGESERAAQLHGAADAVLAARDESFEPFETRLRTRDLEGIRALLGEEAFRTAYEAGRLLSYSEGLHLAGLGA
jgi:predicted ATPase